MKIIHILIALFFLCSCSYQEKNVFPNKITLQGDGIIEYPLSKDCSINSFYKLQQVNINGTEFIYFLDNYKNNVYYFNTNSHELVKTKSIDNEGPNGIKPSTQNHLIAYNFDKYYIYEIKSKKLFSFENDSIVNSIDFNFLYEKRLQGKVDNWFSPVIPENLILRDSKLYFTLSNQLSRITKDEAKAYYNYAELDLPSHEVRVFHKTPNIYWKGNWGASSAVHTTLFHCYNEDEDCFVLGFSGDPDIYQLKVKSDVIEKHSGKSKLIGDIKPTIKDNKNKKEVRRFSSLTPHYGPLYYDPYRGKYLRVVSHGVSEDEYNRGIARKGFSILILDKDFKPIGETFFKDGYSRYSPYKLYINEEGTFMARTDLYNSKSDDFFYFEKFNYVEANQ